MVVKATRKFLKQLADNRAKAKALAKRDEEDKRLLASLFEDPELVDMALRIKDGDPDIEGFEINHCLHDGDAKPTAWRRLGCILGTSAHVKSLNLYMPDSESGDIDALCAGLQRSRTIRRVAAVHTNFHAPRMGHFASFVSIVPTLRDIELFCCTFQPGDMDTLSAALIAREEGTLETLSIHGCNIGGMDLDQFAHALGKTRRLDKLTLKGCGIGPEVCAALSNILESRGTKLRKLDLGDNPIKDDSTVILARSLAKNTTLQSLCLTKSPQHLNRHGPFASIAGWTALLKVVCDTSSINQAMNCNHTLQGVGMWTGELASSEANRSANDALGPDDASILRDALDINRREDKTLVARAKILWGHSRGDFNVADSSLPIGSMPRILEWIGAKDSVIYTQYRWSRYSKSNFGAVKLDAVYRILRSRPGLCN